jgi:hypothetical protein
VSATRESVESKRRFIRALATFVPTLWTGHRILTETLTDQRPTHFFQSFTIIVTDRQKFKGATHALNRLPHIRLLHFKYLVRGRARVNLHQLDHLQAIFALSICNPSIDGDQPCTLLVVRSAVNSRGWVTHYAQRIVSNLQADPNTWAVLT